MLLTVALSDWKGLSEEAERVVILESADLLSATRIDMSLDAVAAFF